MVWIDLIVLAVVAVSVFAGFMRGAIRTVVSIVGVVVAFLVASRESGAVGTVLAGFLPDRIAPIAGFLVVFFGISIVFALGSWLMRKVLEGLSLSWLDRIGGGVLGLARAGVIVGVLALAAQSIGVPEPKESITYPWALRAGRLLLQIVPPDTLRRLDWERLKDWIPGSSQDFI
ncbi:MAG: CvpA family protein [bacterium]